MIVDMYKWNELSDENQQKLTDHKSGLQVSKHQVVRHFHPSTGLQVYDRRLALNLWYHLFHSGTK